MKNISRIRKQSGAVSLFVVIFAILLMSVVTIGFLRIMSKDQSRATGNDLSQSAYDSSLAGVEDAKRALVWYSENCTGASTNPNCAPFEASLSKCNEAIRVAPATSNLIGSEKTGEIKVQQSTKTTSGVNVDEALDQAYTCVTMQVNTDDYLGSLKANESVLIPLVGTSAFATVSIEWFSREDVSNASGTVNVPTPVTSQGLVDNWPADRPSVMRTQFMQVGANFTLTDFDTTNAASESNTNTLFLYPATNGATNTGFTTNDIRKSTDGNSIPDAGVNTPLPTQCTPTVTAGNYACKITLTLPQPVNGGPASSAFLRLSSLYAASHYRITLDGAQFKNVQPIIDSTGRANDVFRRVQSRIDLYDTAFPYPDAAVDTTNSLCKDFGVTDTEYSAGSCTP